MNYRDNKTRNAKSSRVILRKNYLLACLMMLLSSVAIIGCSGGDIPAEDPASSGTTVTAPANSGSILFVSASPTTISLRGTAGSNATETAEIIFKVLDTTNEPVSGKTVTFTLNTSIGGLKLFETSATTDADGKVSAYVIAGIIGTPIRVTATTITNAGETLTTQSDQLVVSTGLPDNDSFSLSVTKINFEASQWEGATTVITARLADHFNNPVPDGTVVFFTSEGGSITPSCTTTDSACTATLTGQAPRPSDGLATILAYAVGEETFYDLDGDGLADLSPNEMLDTLGTSTDLSEAWHDWDSDGTRDSNEPFIDFDNDGVFDGPDGKFNGVLCNETPDPDSPTRVSSAGTCSSQNTMHVRRSINVIFSGSTATINTDGLGGTSWSLSSCSAVDVETLYVYQNSNPLPAGTTISLSSNGDIDLSGTTTFTVANGGFGIGSIIFQVQITGGTSCVAGATGSIDVTVTTPTSGSITQRVITTSTP